jgi:hypothetical protein
MMKINIIIKRTIQSWIQLVRKFSDFQFEALLDFIEYLGILRRSNKRNSQSLGPKAAGACHLTNKIALSYYSCIVLAVQKIVIIIIIINMILLTNKT